MKNLLKSRDDFCHKIWLIKLYALDSPMSIIYENSRASSQFPFEFLY